MKNTQATARYLVTMWEAHEIESKPLVDKHDTPLKLAHALTREQQQLDELIAASKVIVRLLLDEQMHEATAQAADRLNRAIF